MLVRVTDLHVQRDRGRHADPFECQSALEWDPCVGAQKGLLWAGSFGAELKERSIELA